MPQYKPISNPAALIAGESDLAQFYWKENKLWADFLIPENATQFLRVHFKRAEMIRLIDEMPLSTEGVERAEGLVGNNFAYLVKNGKFWNDQSEAFRISFPKLKHYCFVTGWMCLDVLSNEEPAFEIVPAVMIY